MAGKAASVTIRDVARRSGVSAMTVSRVINANERVSPATRRRVEQAISDLGYDNNVFAVTDDSPLPKVGDYFIALTAYRADSKADPEFPNAVLRAWRGHWAYAGPVG